MFLPTMPGDTKSRREWGLILANKIRVQNAISKRPTNAYQFLVILSYLHHEWIAMQHFKFAREHEWVKALSERSGVDMGYCEFLFEPQAETSFNSAVDILMDSGLLEMCIQGEGGFVWLKPGITYEPESGYSTENHYYDSACAILFVARLTSGMGSVDCHMDTCLEIAR